MQEASREGMDEPPWFKCWLPKLVKENVDLFCTSGKDSIVDTVSPVSHGIMRCLLLQICSSVTPAMCYWNSIFVAWTSNKCWNNRVPFCAEASYDLSSESWHSWTKSMLSVTVCLRSPVYLATKEHPGKCTLWIAETRENVLTSYKTKLLGHRTRWKEKLHSIFLICTLTV